MNQYNMQNYNDPGQPLTQGQRPGATPGGLVDVKDSISRHNDAPQVDTEKTTAEKTVNISPPIIALVTNLFKILVQTLLFLVSLPKFAFLLITHVLSIQTASKSLKKRKKKKKKLAKAKSH